MSKTTLEYFIHDLFTCSARLAATMCTFLRFKINIVSTYTIMATYTIMGTYPNMATYFTTTTHTAMVTAEIQQVQLLFKVE